MVQSRQKNRVVFTLATTVLAGMFSLAVSAPGATAAAFRASCVKVDITPEQSQWLLGYAPRRSDGVHDKIYHRVVAMDDGRTQFFLVSSDLCEFSPAVYDGFCRRLEKETGIKPEQFWWTVTHTHSAPEVGPPGLASVFLGE